MLADTARQNHKHDPRRATKSKVREDAKHAAVELLLYRVRLEPRALEGRGHRSEEQAAILGVCRIRRESLLQKGRTLGDQVGFCHVLALHIKVEPLPFQGGLGEVHVGGRIADSNKVH